MVVDNIMVEQDQAILTASTCASMLRQVSPSFTTLQVLLELLEGKLTQLIDKQ